MTRCIQFPLSEGAAAGMCVKTRRLDVAAMCLGNMQVPYTFEDKILSGTLGPEVQQWGAAI